MLGKPSGGEVRIEARQAPESRAPFSWLRRDVVFALLLAIGTLATYAPIRHGEFLMDDAVLLTNNALIKQADGWWQVWCARVVDYVPTASTTFWIEWRLWGSAPFGYHLDNVLLHVLAALVVWRVLLRLAVPGARLAAVLFAVHPVCAESVAWISERKNTLAMVLFASAALWYLVFEDTGKKRWYWAALGAFLLGILSKTAVAPLPLVLLGMAWWRRGRVDRKDMLQSVPFFVVGVAAGFLGVWIQHQAPSSFNATPQTFLWRLAAAGFIVWFYLFKVLLPLNLIVIYPVWRIDTGDPGSYLPGFLATGVFVVCWFCRRTWGRPILAAFGYFTLLLAPVLGFVDLSFMRATLVADRWQYFAMIGPISLVSAAIAVFLRGKTANRWVLSTGLVIACGVLTWNQAWTFTSNYSMWQKTVDKNPNAFFAQAGLGEYLYEKGRKAEALSHYRKALELNPGFLNVNYDLGTIALQEGRVSEAAYYYQRALQIQPENALACNNLAWILATSPLAPNRDGVKAVELAQRADKVSGGKNPSFLGTLAAAYAEAGRFPEAIAAIHEAQRLASTRENAGQAKDLQSQLECYQRGLPFRDVTDSAPSAASRK